MLRKTVKNRPYLNIDPLYVKEDRKKVMLS
jgi:hypothetical protein